MNGKPHISTAYGIRNPYGDIWTEDTFPTPQAAEKHLRDFWGDDAASLKGFSVVIVEIEVRDTSCAALPAKPVGKQAAPKVR